MCFSLPRVRRRLTVLIYPAFVLALAGCLSPNKIEESQTTVLFRRNLTPAIAKSGSIYLRPGDSALVEVWARLPANSTRIVVTPGMRLRFLVPPGQLWTDFYIQTDASGYTHGPLAFIQERFASTKPLPNENWFALIGAINRPDTPVFVMRKCDKRRDIVDIHDTGKLILFANDARCFYWNNFGRLEVVITRLK